MNAQVQEKWDKFRSDLKITIGNEKYERWGDLLILNDFESNTRKLVINCGNTYLYRSAQKHHDLMKDILEDGTDLVLKQVPSSPGVGLKGIGQFTVPSPAAKPTPKPKIERIKKPKCSKKQRMMPAIFARSPLFGMVKRGKRRYVNNELIISWKGYRIRFKGYQLSQKELDVWLEAFYRAVTAKDYRFYFTFYDFLKALGRAMKGGRNHNLLDNSFTLLNICYVEIEKKGVIIYAGKLIDTYQRPIGQTKGIAGINPDIINLFEKDYILIDWEFRKGLKTDLAKWEYNYIRGQHATVENPHWIGTEKLQSLCGSTDTNPRRFWINFKKTGSLFTDILESNEVTNNIWTIVRK